MNDDTLSRDERAVSDDDPIIAIDEILQQSLAVANGDPEIEQAVTNLERTWEDLITAMCPLPMIRSL